MNKEILINNLNAEESAVSIMGILSANYGSHNLTKNIEPLIKDIQSGKLYPFVQNENGKPVACAALIKLNENDVEIGRGACLPGKNGGKSLPLLNAFESWNQEIVFPNSKVLRAEVRTAKPTKEVPGGQATQVICFNKIGLKPTAIGPFFHHGIPDRQEMFFLASKFKKLPKLQNLEIPISIFSNQSELIVFSFFWKNYFNKTPKFINNEIQNLSDKTVNLDKNDTRFTTFRMNLKNVTSIPKSFSLVGFEPILNNNRLDIEIIFGKLSPEGKTNLILPSFVENIFPQKVEDALMELSISWRK